MKTLAIDFDGVVHKYSKGWHDGTCYDVPMEGAIEALKSLMRHHTVFIFTTRDLPSVQDWFGRYGQQTVTEIISPDKEFWDKPYVLGLSNRKLAAIAYIDDRAVRFTNWTDMLNYF